MSSAVNSPQTVLQGVLPVLHTPFTDSGHIDPLTLHREIDWAFEIGADGVVVAAGSVDGASVCVAGEQAASAATSINARICFAPDVKRRRV